MAPMLEVLASVGEMKEPVVTDNSAWQQAAGESTYPTYPSQPAMGGAASQSSSEAETTRLQTPAQPQTQVPVSAPPLTPLQTPISAPPEFQSPASSQSQVPPNAPASGSGQPMFPHGHGLPGIRTAYVAIVGSTKHPTLIV
jgi:hypothetical protein